MAQHPSKFHQLLSSANREAVLQERITVIADSARIAQEVLINQLKSKKIGLESRAREISDVGPNTSIDLKPGSNFDAGNWASQLHNIRVQLKAVDIELEVANATYIEYFGTPVVTPDEPTA